MANGELDLGKMPRAEDIPAHRSATNVDTLLALLLTELTDAQVAGASADATGDAMAPNSVPHWDEALERIRTIQRQVNLVELAMIRALVESAS